MATQQPETGPVEPWGWLAVLLCDGTGHERCYDAFAPQLYRYCWSLMGQEGNTGEPDRAAATVHQVFLAATELIGELQDPDDLRPWFFALARAASRQRGFARASSYAALATVPDERPAVELLLRLPPSHRELLELHLRHDLPAARIGTVLGLAPGTSRELCRAAVRRAATVLADRGTGAHRAPDPDPETSAEREVRACLDRLEPPGPPGGLRERVLHDCTDPLMARERRAAAEALPPLDSDGFPLHGGLCTTLPTPVPEPDTESDDTGDGTTSSPEEPAAVPSDRVTTRDVPAETGSEQVAELRPPREEDMEGGGTAHRRKRWPAPVAAGLVTAAVAAAVGGAVAMGYSAGVVTDPGPPDPAFPLPVAGEQPGEVATAPALPAEPSPGPPSPDPGESTGPLPSDTPSAPASPGSEVTTAPSAPSDAPSAPAPSAPGPDDPGGAAPTAEPPDGEDGDDGDGRGPVSRLLSELAELLGQGD